jgi:hypothetical protein
MHTHIRTRMYAHMHTRILRRHLLVSNIDKLGAGGRLSVSDAGAYCGLSDIRSSLFMQIHSTETEVQSRSTDKIEGLGTNIYLE